MLERLLGILLNITRLASTDYKFMSDSRNLSLLSLVIMLYQTYISFTILALLPSINFNILSLARLKWSVSCFLVSFITQLASLTVQNWVSTSVHSCPFFFHVLHSSWHTTFCISINYYNIFLVSSLQFYKNFCAKLDNIIWKPSEGHG